MDRNQTVIEGANEWTLDSVLASPDAEPDGENTAQSYVDDTIDCVVYSQCPASCVNFGHGWQCDEDSAEPTEVESVEDDGLSGPACTTE
jgi:hypothetical protein